MKAKTSRTAPSEYQPSDNQPDYRVHALHRVSRMTTRVGAAWNRDDGSISIKLDGFITLNNNDGELILSLFKNND